MKIKSRVPLIIGFLLLSLAGLAYYLNQILIPEYRILRVELGDARQILSNKNAELMAIKELDRNFASLQRQAQLALTALPSDKEIPVILYQLTSICDELGIKSNTLSVSTSPKIEPKSTVQSIEFTISVSATYPQLIEYLRRVEGALRLTNVRSISVGGSSTLSSAETLLNASFRGDAFFTSSEPAPTTTRRTTR